MYIFLITNNKYCIIYEIYIINKYYIIWPVKDDQDYRTIEELIDVM